MKILDIILRVVLGLIILAPILGATGIFPEPTPDLYNTEEAFAFIEMLYATGYIIYIDAAIYAVSIALIIMNRMALVALLILPITVNITAFHLFLDGGLFTAGAIMSNILLAINAYYLWQNRARYVSLLDKSAAPIHAEAPSA